MYRPLIKICGIRTPELARAAAFVGVHFIGIVFHPESKRFVSIEQAKDISAAAKEKGATPIAVFVDQSAIQMNEICRTTDIQVVQLHGATARKQHFMLPDNYQRFYAQSVLPNGVVNKEDDSGLHYCDPERDYLLFDNAQAGNGLPFNWNQFNYSDHFRMCLAGGLTPDNVAVAIKKFQPAVVDTSSGVENLSGEKELERIKNFISAVNVSSRGVNNE